MTTSKLISFLGEDNAESFFNLDYNETYHSKIGPTIEAFHKFVKPSCIEELSKQNKKIKILDPFFGLGYNTGLALELAYKAAAKPEIEIVAIEKDIEIIKKITGLKVPAWYLRWNNLLSYIFPNIKNNFGFIKHENVTINIHIECIFNIIHKLPKEEFNVIFFDPFSHKTCREFWTDEFLTIVFSLLAKGGTLTTYSSLKKVENLAVSLGYKPIRVEPIGRKKHSLLIKKQQMIS